MDDSQIMEALSRDYSVGTEGFREGLLERCLSVLCQEDGGLVLDDDELFFEL